ncbi:MAG: glycosyltransferase family 39 protein, partial [Deltaproteobacteria bacterium]|nr:glycosyltransferase family 39 protein [Deltaproteobacteria bacterium]
MRRRLAGPFFLVIAWCAAVALVGPRGNFPLSDDWAFAHAARSLCHGGGLDLLPWTGASVIFQAAYGAMLCRLFGSSYEVLRASTLVLGASGVAVFYCLLRRLGAAPAAATAGAGVVAAGPLYFNLSFTFMTDLPFAVTALMATSAYARGLSRNSRSDLLAASCLAAASLLIRQHAVFIAAAAAAAALLPGAPGLRRRAGNALCAAGPAFVAAVAYAAWIVSGLGVPDAIHHKVNEAASTPLLEIGNAAFRGLVTVGFLLAPVGLTLAPSGASEKRIAATTAAALTSLALFLYLREGASMFYLTNVLYDLGVGCVTLRDQFFLAMNDLPRAGPALRLPATALSIASASLLVARWSSLLVGEHASAAKRLGDPVKVFVLLAFAASFVGSLAQAAYYFDRYLIAIAPLGLAAAVAARPRWRSSIASGSLTALMALFSIAGTHDWMEWNRARWDLLQSLEARGVQATSIDGGMEYNAERLAARLRTSPSDAAVRPGQPPSVKSWWWVVDDEWIVSFGTL